MIRRRRADDRRQRGQGLVEFALVLPIFAVIVVSIGELGLIFGKISSLGYASREGARVGSALALGDSTLCSPSNQDPSMVDASLVAAVQRILRSPDSGIAMNRIQQVRIFKADAAGREIGGLVNIWTYAGPGMGPEVDPGPGRANIDFVPSQVVWNACSRVNTGSSPDSIGVTVSYTYDFVTPMPQVLDSLSGGSLNLTLSETTVMALNPTL
jgi:hypothetical protein